MRNAIVAAIGLLVLGCGGSDGDSSGGGGGGGSGGGGGGGGSGGGTSDPQSSVWSGTFTQSPEEEVMVLTSSGQIPLLSADGTATGGRAVGTVIVGEGHVWHDGGPFRPERTGDQLLHRYARDDDARRTYEHLGLSAYDFAPESDGSATGHAIPFSTYVDRRPNLQNNPTLRAQLEEQFIDEGGEFELQAHALSQHTAQVEDFTGTWFHQEPSSGYAFTLTIDAEGEMLGADSDGCAYSGRVVRLISGEVVFPGVLATHEIDTPYLGVKMLIEDCDLSFGAVGWEDGVDDIWSHMGVAARIGDELLLALPLVIMSGSPVLYVRLQ